MLPLEMSHHIKRPLLTPHEDQQRSMTPPTACTLLLRADQVGSSAPMLFFVTIDLFNVLCFFSLWLYYLISKLPASRQTSALHIECTQEAEAAKDKSTLQVKEDTEITYLFTQM